MVTEACPHRHAHHGIQKKVRSPFSDVARCCGAQTAAVPKKTSDAAINITLGVPGRRADKQTEKERELARALVPNVVANVEDASQRRSNPSAELHCYEA